MKKLNIILLVMCLVSVGLFAQQSVNMPGTDGQEHTQAVTSDLLFYDAGGDVGPIPTAQQVTGITFTPPIGKMIQIVFDTIDLQGGSKIVLWNGAKSLNSEDDGFGNIEYSLPSGGDATYAMNMGNTVFTSSAADGSVTVFFSNTNGTGSGWKATVKLITPTITPQIPTGDVLMSTTPAIYLIGSTPVNFYDDGGASGNISQNFEGRVTFAPTNAGKKIKVTFSSLQLFNTSNTGYNDILKVYNGKNIANDSLIATLLKNPTPLTLKSSAADGALTVYLKSTTGYPKPGFAAVVEEYTPQNMTFDNVTLKQTPAEVVAGDKEQSVLSINIATSDNDNPLSVSKLNFNTNGTFANIEKAYLYYLGNDTTGVAHKVGEVNVAADNFDITLATPQTLLEGNNYFLLKYDIKTDAAQGTSIDAGCTSVVVGGTTHTTTAPHPTGSLTVNNTYVSAVGTFSKTIYGDWQFINKKTTYNNNYEEGTSNQVITFLPGIPNSKVQIDFSEFAIYMSSNSFGTKAKFEIYSGVGTSGTLLWKAQPSNKNTGPGTTVRSNSADGALTIVFNPNTNISSYTAKGWKAIVSLHQSVPMTFSRVDVVQKDTSFVTPGTAKAEIIGLNVVTSGELLPLTLNSVNVGLKGCESKVKKVSLYHSDGTGFATDSLVGTLQAPLSANAVIALAQPFALSAGNNYFWVTYDIDSTATSGSFMDALVSEVNVGGTAHTVANGDPAGRREVKNVYLFRGDDVVNVNGKLMFYDNGGPNTNYKSTASGAVTFKPRAGEVIKIVFNYINTYNSDYFIVRNGGVAGETIAEYSGTILVGDNLPKPIVSSAADGSLTIEFKDPKGTYNKGWEIEVYSIVPRPLAISNITATAVQGSNLLKGAQEQMLKIDVSVEGERDTLNISSFDFSTVGSTNIGADISKVRLYTTGINDRFVAHNEYAHNDTAVLRINGSTAIVKEGVYKFWLVYDASPSATIGNTVTAKLDSVKTGTRWTTPSTTATASRNIVGGFSGTYTVGDGSSDYPTIKAAIDAMKGGIDGKVVFNIVNGIYDQTVVIPHIPGASPENTITIKSESGNPQDVTIQYDKYVLPKFQGKDLGIFSINGADYITIENITVKAGKLGYPANILVNNISNHVTVRNCRIEAPRGTSTYKSRADYLIRVEANDSLYRNSDYFTLENSTLDGGNVAVCIYGTNFVRLPKQKEARIAGNTFVNQSRRCIYMTKEDGGIIENNTFTISGTANISEFLGVDAVMMGNTIIRGNRFYADSTAGKTYPLHLRQAGKEEMVQGRNKVYNNQIIIDSVGGTYASYGIECNEPLKNVDIVYNSINIRHTNGLSHGNIHFAGNKSHLTEGVLFANNLLQNSAPKGEVYNLNNNGYLAGITFKNNGYYTVSDTIASIGSTEYNFAGWNTVSGDQNSIVEQAQFVDPSSSLDLSDLGSLAAASPIGYVTTDIDGKARNASTPTIGAYEFVLPTPEFAAGYPYITDIKANSAKAKIKTLVNGKVFFLAKLSSEAAPSVAQVIAADSIDINKSVEKEVTIGNLNSSSEYKAYFVIKTTYGSLSGVIVISAFSTPNAPTEVSTFENVTVATGDFVDGTAQFSGFEVKPITDGQGSNNHKAAKLVRDSVSVTINNSTEGLTLTGFYFKSDTAVSLNAYKGTVKVGSRTLSATAGKWVFIDLKAFGKITTVVLKGTGNIMIDDFSGAPQPLTFTLPADTIVNENMSIMLGADINGGVVPYIYSWTNAHRDTLSSTDKLNLTAQKTDVVTLVVTDAWGNTHKAKIVVTVRGTAKVATFDDLYLPAESYWWGDTVPNYKNTFYSGSYSFANSMIPYSQTWGLFGYSNKTSKSFDPDQFITDQFNSVVGHGVNGSSNYAVVYPSHVMGHTMVVPTHKPQGDSIRGCYVTNNAWVKYVSIHGTGTDSKGKQDKHTPFTTGDWVKLTAKADNGKSVSFYLADYRSSNPADHYLIESWQWLDLRSLGVVKNVTFTMDGTRHNQYGTTIPTYFCMDDFGGDRPLTTFADTVSAEVGKTKMVNLNTLLPAVDTKGASIEYAITDEADNTLADISVVGIRLKITAHKAGKSNIVLRRTVKGESEFIVLWLKFENTTTDTDLADTESIIILPNPATDSFSVNRSGTLEIFTLSGKKVYSDVGYRSGETVNITGYSQGTYIVKIDGKAMKLIVR
jgi:hypothetical protein